MKKLFAVVLSALFVVAVAVPVLATDARQIALGGAGNYIEDDYNIFTWYGTLPSYSNTVWIGLNYDMDGEMSYTPLPYIGASYALGSEGKYGTLAMFFNETGRPLNFGDWGWDISGQENYYWWDAPYSDYAYSKWNVLYGYAMEKLSFGLYFSRSDRRSEYESSYDFTRPALRDTAFDDVDAVSYTTIGAGVRFDIGEKMYADLAFDYNWAGMTLDEKSPNDYYYEDYYHGFGEISADANKMMNFRGRMFYECNETITLVPYASFGTFNFSLKSDSSQYVDRLWDEDGVDTLGWKDTHYGVKGMGITFGIAANIKVNENNLLLFAVEPFSYYKLEQSDPPTGFVRYDYYDYEDEDADPYWWGVTHESKTMILPAFRLALESDVRDWLTFRIGAVKTFYKDEDKESYTSQYYDDPALDVVKYEETDTYVGSDFEYWMGLGFHVGDFDIDAVIDNELPFRLGYWLTGYNSDQSDPIYMLSATYHF
ncbi:MAG: hypothetical protein NTW97_11345 [Candidatus Krumholzibacteria bacterium]|nr:hypothetical protein [Candidatus Krumholzibacteria bacterium]